MLLVAALGVASQIHPNAVSLAEVIQQSSTILVVEDAAPPHRDLRLDAGTVALETRLSRVRVVEVLRSHTGPIAPEQVLEVGEAHLDTMLSVHQLYYDEGIAESPIYDTYEGGGPSTGRRVVFLQPCTLPGGVPQLCLSAVGAVEKIENLPAIRQHLATP